MRTIAMLVLVAALGCDASPNSSGYGERPQTNARGDVDAGSGGAGGSPVTESADAGGAGGRSGAGGARAEVGGATGAGGALAGVGGMTGAGGSGTGGRAVAGPDTPYCGDLGYSLGFSSCVEQPSPGVFINGTTTDGHACAICPGVPAGVQCWQLGALCVASCSECVFQ